MLTYRTCNTSSSVQFKQYFSFTQFTNRKLLTAALMPPPRNFSIKIVICHLTQNGARCRGVLCFGAGCKSRLVPLGIGQGN